MSQPARRRPGRWRRARWGLLFMAAIPAGCGLPKVNSQWLDRPAAVDGDLAKWQGSLYAFADDQVYLGVRNDRSNLYLCLATGNEVLERQFVRLGATCWIDPGGGKAKVLGLHFPARAPELDRQPGQHRWTFSPEAAIKALADSTTELEILQGEGPGTRMPVGQAGEIGLKIAYRDEMLVYELRIPLSAEATHSFAVRAEPGQSIGLGFETPKMVAGGPLGREGRPGWGRGPGPEDAPSEGPEGGDSGPPHDQPGDGPGRGRPGMGMGGSRGAMRGAGRRPGIPEPLKVWVQIRLAAEGGR